MKLILATNNQHKLTEFRRVLDPIGVTVISQNEAGISVDVEETGKTFEENAKLKADAIYQLTGLPTVADDSGLEVDILDNAPGVYTARYAGENATDADRYNKLLGEMKAVKDADRTACFVCVLHYIDSDGVGHSMRGECFGKIGYEPKGANGFGYDPVFMVGSKSFSELLPEEKDAVSHRGKALQMLADLIQKQK